MSIYDVSHYESIWVIDTAFISMMIGIMLGSFLYDIAGYTFKKILSYWKNQR